MVKWEKKNKEKVLQNALLIQLLIFTKPLTEFNSRRKHQEPFLKSEKLSLKWWKQKMLELILNSINSSGTKVSETYQEEWELEFQEKELKKKDQTNGTHSFNTLMLNLSKPDSLKNLKFLHDFHHYPNLLIYLFYAKNPLKNNFIVTFMLKSNKFI